MVGRRLEAALSASNDVKSQSSDLFINSNGEIRCAGEKCICSDVLLESEAEGRIAFSGYNRDIYAHRIFSLPVENWRRSWRVYNFLYLYTSNTCVLLC